MSFHNQQPAPRGKKVMRRAAAITSRQQSAVGSHAAVTMQFPAAGQLTPRLTELAAFKARDTSWVGGRVLIVIVFITRKLHASAALQRCPHPR
ncbi:hypothetical protein BaRGS_00007398 [Batillaria attramentaria]|uniref:Uncharacterized protein n=1 Tax=Batillaria attramentaria TaxID=370345 RepID=A0ABD0LQI4_9CAEN